MKTTLRMSISSSLALCLVLLSISFDPSSTARAKVALSVDADIDDGARQFDEAVKDIESILNLDLSNEAGAKQADKIFKRNEKKLLHYEKKALQAALRSSAFEQGIKQEAAKRKGGADELARELESKPDAIGQIPGVEEAATAIKNSTKPAADTLQRVADALKKAADAAKKKNVTANQHHASTLTVPAASAPSQPTTLKSPESFCLAHPEICTLLTKLGLSYLRSAVAGLYSTGVQAKCVVNAYGSFTGCTIFHWWDQLYCQSAFASRIKWCLSFSY
jgi:hypothetical protein